jgi:hypothetical protein
MFKEVLTADDNTLIDKAYVLDENLLEPVYILRSIDPEKKDEWQIIEKELGSILRRVSDICLQNNRITQTERNEFHISGEIFLSVQALSLRIF